MFYPHFSDPFLISSSFMLLEKFAFGRFELTFSVISVFISASVVCIRRAYRRPVHGHSYHWRETVQDCQGACILQKKNILFVFYTEVGHMNICDVLKKIVQKYKNVETME